MTHTAADEQRVPATTTAVRSASSELEPVRDRRSDSARIASRGVSSCPKTSLLATRWQACRAGSAMSAATVIAPTSDQPWSPENRAVRASTAAYTTPITPVSRTTSSVRLSTTSMSHSRYRRTATKSMTGTMANRAGKAASSIAATPATTPSKPAIINNRSAIHSSDAVRAGASATRSSRDCCRTSAGSPGSRSRAVCAAMPTTGTSTPKKTTKNGGWAMKLLRQHTQATSSVPSTAPTASRWAAAPRAGSRPSGNSSTAQRYATPEARWKAKCTPMTTGSCASRWKASWLGALKVAAVPRQAMDTSRGTTSWGR